MARKARTPRPDQISQLLAQAEQLLAQSGPESLTARNLAAALGVSLGQIYNLMPDMGTLQAELKIRLLDALYSELQTATAQKALATNPRQRLHLLAQTYIQFCHSHKPSWALLLLPAHHQALPDDTQQRLQTSVARLPQLVADIVSELAPMRATSDKQRDVMTLWIGLQGLASLEAVGTLGRVQNHLARSDTATDLATHMVENCITAMATGAT
jgi:AcrR family transcriptional regulator